MGLGKIIETLDLEKVYGMGDIRVAALDGVSVQIDAGEFVAIMGPSGSGKSTLMNILGCLDRPTGGNYLLDGVDVSDLDKRELATIRNRKIGFVFQSYNLLARTSALQNVMLPLLYNRDNHHGSQQREEIAKRVLAQVGLADRIDHQPQELSGGQQQRVAIARALAKNPKVIIADEPTGNLDSKTGKDVMEIIQNLNKNEKRTVILITHETYTAEHAKRIVYIRDGEVESDTLVKKQRRAHDGFKK
ncbi:MAG: ABC transporter ATP-binding protein [Candidatus Pacebacteria bacterium]|nr:ABC transporter ATP-binding protein [Candidatus Paceibacterota bacterium]